MSVTAPLHEEHADLLPCVAELGNTAASVGSWPSGTADRLAAIVAFLRDHLVPHARAEEEALYPTVERVLGAPGATGTMKADHVEVVKRIDALADLVGAVGARPPSVEQAEQLRAQLYGLEAILVLHFHKEEEVLLPVLDEHLSEEEAQDMFHAMVAVAHPDHHHVA